LFTAKPHLTDNATIFELFFYNGKENGRGQRFDTHEQPASVKSLLESVKSV